MKRIKTTVLYIAFFITCILTASVNFAHQESFFEQKTSQKLCIDVESQYTQTPLANQEVKISWNSWETCPKCWGKGWLDVILGDGREIERICDLCKGRGKIKRH